MLVGAFACAHTPQLLARPETEDRELVLRVHAAFARVKRRLEALRPDAIAMIAGDHIEAFFLSAVPALAVYVGTECAGTFGRYRYRFPIHEPLARALVEAGIERGVDLVYTQDAPLDYGTITWKIGIAAPGASQWRWAMNGVVDEVRIYNRALTSQEVAALYSR